MRLNRDTRFSKNKSPYKDYFGLWFREGTGKSRECPGFFLALTGEGTLVLGAGMHQFQPGQLEAYRRAVVDREQGAALRRLVDRLAKAGATIGVSQLKRVPQGFDPDHANADLLRHVGLVGWHESAIPRELFTAAAPAYCTQRAVAFVLLHRWLIANVA
ncbi:MAG: DUF2461 family protein [Alphaproteobacteria bacterium]|nr:DUF2461 family protein [Alphaproteobacteria bacterium]